MSREEKINKMIEEIKIRRNDEQYRGGPFPIYHIEFDILNEEIERLNKLLSIEKDYRERFDKDNQKLHSIIKEVREYIMINGIHSDYGDKGIDDENKLLEILDKENI